MITNLKKTQHNLKLIRRFDEDIWGVLSIKDKPSSVLNYLYEAYQNNFKYKKLLKSRKRSFFLVRKRGKFIYKVVTGEKEFRRRRRSIKINKYLNLLKLRRFYGNLGEKKFKRLFRHSTLKTNLIGRSFPYLLESRLDVILYRANFFNSIYAAKQFINHKKVYVNGKIVNKPGLRVSVNDIITVKEPLKVYNSLKDRLLKNQVLVNHPVYLEVNYKLGSVIMTQIPTADNVPFPFFMNLNMISHNFSK